MSVETRPHGGIGESIRRKEDARFLRGRGNYVDDLELPGMLHMVILRSPHAHARITSIDTAAASAAPGVVAGGTRDPMAQHKPALVPKPRGGTHAPPAPRKGRLPGPRVAAAPGQR